jgi:hypothetical protein
MFKVVGTCSIAITIEGKGEGVLLVDMNTYQAQVHRGSKFGVK